ncbi:MAG: hypothetical protein HN922_02845 [Anaerolineae bacterium]|jgi:polysaccharide biosynthesis protein VpsQ|nr:hypothetical protein [Anaerolineae bacterium]
MKKNRIPISLIIFALIIIFLADSGNLPRVIRQLYDFPNGDKIGHFFLMGLLSYTLNQAALSTRNSSSNKKRNDRDLNLGRLIWTVSLSLAFFVTFEEISQIYFPHRTFSLSDLAVNYLGIALFAWIAWKRR